MLSFEIVERSVMSDTPTCFFLNPSFQSACTHPESALVVPPRSSSATDLDESTCTCLARCRSRSRLACGCLLPFARGGLRAIGGLAGLCHRRG